MQPIDKFLDRLDKVRKSGKGWIACCPAHADKSPSLNLTEAPDGKVLIHCFAGCYPSEICNALGLDEQDMFPPKPEPIYSPGTPAPEPKPYFSRQHRDDLELQVWFVAVVTASIRRRERVSEKDMETYRASLKSLAEARWGLFCANHIDLFMQVDSVLQQLENRSQEAA